MAVKIGSGDDNPATDSCCVADKVVCGILHHCSAWTFYLLGSVVLATAVLSFLMQQSQGIEALQMLTGGFVIFMIPQVVGGVVLKPQGGNCVVLPWEKSCPRLDIGRLTLFMG